MLVYAHPTRRQGGPVRLDAQLLSPALLAFRGEEAFDLPAESAPPVAFGAVERGGRAGAGRPQGGGRVGGSAEVVVTQGQVQLAEAAHAAGAGPLQQRDSLAVPSQLQLGDAEQRDGVAPGLG